MTNTGEESVYNIYEYRVQLQCGAYIAQYIIYKEYMVRFSRLHYYTCNLEKRHTISLSLSLSLSVCLSLSLSLSVISNHI